jgi:hypothetical protein
VGGACIRRFDGNLRESNDNCNYHPHVRGLHIKAIQVAVDAGLAASLAMALQAEQGGGGEGGAATAGTSGALIGGTLAPAKPNPPGCG